MIRISRQIFLSLVSCLAFAQLAMAAPVVLPPPVVPYAVQYDNFFSYSAKLLTGFGLPGFDVNTGTGGLDVLIYTGANGANNTGVGAGGLFNFPDPLAAPGGGDTSVAGVWGPTNIPVGTGPIPVSYMLDYLHATFGAQANVPIFDFDMNQTGASPDLQVVGQVRVRNASNTVIASWAFDNITDNKFEDTAWVTAPGTITATNPLPPFQSVTVDNNKGSGKLDFIVYAPTMNLALFNAAGNTIEFDFRMQGLNDGFEELFLTGGFAPAAVPEPGTMLLMGIGAAGAAFMRRRAKKAH
ncbi:PEP-CTERM sorting domain-containing protein [Fundidesulfovibrio terrae]|uniref:PEP-CTERM sorting domain-containing protein n=1 Tax=Fundidesulfovibrio terrae TaxID=2922866 RepID=UPI001FAF2982|nr:PEP-CTERM sorting domain-containing protein [Fundidesulfovibrio terrae]